LPPIARTVFIQEPDQAELFFERNGVKAWASRVDHFPAKPAVGYRFEYHGKKVVITGIPSNPALWFEPADKADLFICEALDAKTIHLAARGAKRLINLRCLKYLPTSRITTSPRSRPPKSPRQPGSKSWFFTMSCRPRPISF
jgi:ribonuclease Z